MQQLSLVVALVRWTVMCAPEARVKVPHPRVWFGAVPLTEQVMPAGIELPPASLGHRRSLVRGCGSESVVPVESPGPAFVRVTVKPMGLRSEERRVGKDCVRGRLGQLTVSEACLVSVPSLPETKVAE